MAATTSRHTIGLYLANGQWMAKHSDPAVREAFGTDTLPTPYWSTIDTREMLSLIRERNPTCTVDILDRDEDCKLTLREEPNLRYKADSVSDWLFAETDHD